MAKKFIACSVKEFETHAERLEAAEFAVKTFPANRPRVGLVPQAMQAFAEKVGVADFFKGADADLGDIHPDFLAVLVTKYHGAGGVDLTVSFLEETSSGLRDRILAHMSAWGDFSNVRFRWVKSDGQVRITRELDGYWSYLGTDVLRVPPGEPTMCLEGFTEKTPESEYRRVVRHETGHTCGFPHEHMRKQLVNRLDVNKTIKYFQRTQGWSPATTRQQVLTPLSDASVRGTPDADDVSIMCYQLPGSITKDGKPIPGGTDIDAADRAFAASVYPKSESACDESGARVDPDAKVVYVPSGWTVQVVK